MVSLILKQQKLLAEIKAHGQKCESFVIDMAKLEKSLIRSLTGGLF